jgi:C1A family cysteine protease
MEERLLKGATMRRNIAQVVSAAIVILVLVAASGHVYGDTDSRQAELDLVRQMIEENGYSWTAGPTEISDLPAEERQKLLGLRVPEDYERILEEIRQRQILRAPMDLPARFDWTDSAAVSPVRNQRCGDCWAQCSVAAMESQLRIYDDDITRLSVQQAIDCNFGGSGCDGGWWEDVYDMYMAVGAVTQACYPYRNGVDGDCDEDTCDIVTYLNNYELIDTSVASLKYYLMTYGPLAVGMSVYNDFSYYRTGCYETSQSGNINHGVLLVGWDDSKCSGQGAWHMKNSWGTSWGESGYGWMKYGTADIGYGACVTYYTPRERVKLAYQSQVVDDSAGDNDGVAEPGETVTLRVSLFNQRWDTATNVSATLMSLTPGVEVLSSGSTTFPNIPGGGTAQSNSPHFLVSVDPDVICGQRAHFGLSIECDQGTCYDNCYFDVGDAVATVFADDAEADLSWTLGAPGDEATTGAWVRKNPRGSLLDRHLVQAERDHSPGSTVMAFVTANTNRSFHPDFADVDGGKRTLTSPVFDLSGKASALARYWKWYTNDTGDSVADDSWRVDVSADGGLTWVNLEDQTESHREWRESEFDLGQYVPLTGQVVFRFVASDYGNDSTVEAAVDDFEITGCPASVDALPPYAEVIYPNGGEAIVENTEVNVEWTATDDYGLREVTVLASYDGGLTYEDTLGVMTGFQSSLTWQVPAGDHPDCRIGIEAVDRGYNTVFDQSDSPFAITLDVAGVDVADKEADEVLPAEVVLVGSERNPFSGSTHIFFGLPTAMDVKVKVYDARGRCVRDLLDAPVAAGYHSVIWDGSSTAGARVSPGIYFLHLTAGNEVRTAKVMLAG